MGNQPLAACGQTDQRSAGRLQRSGSSVRDEKRDKMINDFLMKRQEEDEANAAKIAALEAEAASLRKKADAATERVHQAELDKVKAEMKAGEEGRIRQKAEEEAATAKQKYEEEAAGKVSCYDVERRGMG